MSNTPCPSPGPGPRHSPCPDPPLRLRLGSSPKNKGPNSKIFIIPRTVIRAKTETRRWIRTRTVARTRTKTRTRTRGEYPLKLLNLAVGYLFKSGISTTSGSASSE